MPDFTNELTIETEIGNIRATSTIFAGGLTDDQISLRAVNFKPKLPPNMSVKKCTAVILVVDGLVELQKLKLKLSIESKAMGHRCTGQCLDAQEWSDDGKLVVVGTEDGEALSYRFPKFRFEDKAIVDYSEHSLALNLNNLTELKRPSFHFIIAENVDPEPVDASAWFAVDQRHKYLLEQ